MEKRSRSDDISDGAELDDQNLLVDPVVVKAIFAVLADTVDAELLVRFTGYVSAEMPAVGFERNHGELRYWSISRMEYTSSSRCWREIISPSKPMETNWMPIIIKRNPTMKSGRLLSEVFPISHSYDK